VIAAVPLRPDYRFMGSGRAVRLVLLLAAVATAAGALSASARGGGGLSAHGDHRGALAPAGDAMARRGAALAKPLYWGAWIGSQLTGGEAPWDWGAVQRFEAMTGKSVSLVSFASPFVNCAARPCTPYEFPRSPFTAIRRHGAIPFFSWSSASWPVAALEPGFTLRAVAEGRFDSYIARWAAAARRWGHPFFLRFDWEMNSSEFPWSLASNGGNPAAYVAAWRHVHRLFARAGARNATWVWCPNADPEQDPATIASLYPGRAYVDWTCLDGYNRDDPWRSFTSIFRTDYELITEHLAPGKPMMIGETASTETGGSKAAWIAGMFASLPSFPAVRGLIWFDRASGGDWPAESSPSSLAAFSRGLLAGPFASGRFDAIVASPIPPASG
jgi:Glycosyl hydrolase family 26